MTASRYLLAPFALACGVALGALPAAHAAVTLKTSTMLVRNHDQIIVFYDHFVKPVQAAKGAVRLNMIGGPEITPASKQGRAMQRGVVDMIFGPSSYYGGQVPEARFVALANQDPDALRRNGGWDILEKAFGDKINGHILAWPFFSGSNFYTFVNFEPKLSKKTGVDFSGISFRSNATYKALVQALHATPVTVSPSDIYTGMQRGVIKGLMYPEGGITALGWQAFVKYRIEPGFWHSTSMLVINKDKWASLSHAEKTFLNKMAKQFEDQSSAALRKRADIDNAKVFKSGVKHFPLKGVYRDAYLRTAYEAPWAAARKYKHLTVPLEQIKAKLYVPGGGS